MARASLTVRMRTFDVIRDSDGCLVLLVELYAGASTQPFAVQVYDPRAEDGE